MRALSVSRGGGDDRDVGACGSSDCCRASGCRLDVEHAPPRDSSHLFSAAWYDDWLGRIQPMPPARWRDRI